MGGLLPACRRRGKERTATGPGGAARAKRARAIKGRARTKSNSANGKASADTMRNNDLAIVPIVSAQGDGIKGPLNFRAFWRIYGLNKIMCQFVAMEGS